MKPSSEIVSAAFERVLKSIDADFLHFRDDLRDVLPFGWLHIIEYFHDSIVGVAPYYFVSNVKCSRGSLILSLDYDSVPEPYLLTVLTAVAVAEDSAAITCEECGSTSATTRVDLGWLFVICDVCFASRGVSRVD